MIRRAASELNKESEFEKLAKRLSTEGLKEAAVELTKSALENLASAVEQQNMNLRQARSSSDEMQM